MSEVSLQTRDGDEMREREGLYCLLSCHLDLFELGAVGSYHSSGLDT